MQLLIFSYVTSLTLLRPLNAVFNAEIGGFCETTTTTTTTITTTITTITTSTTTTFKLLERDARIEQGDNTVDC